MNDRPHVSIVIPCYNSAKYLVETINSVKDQTYNSWECIIVNDGSNDETERVILSEINKDERFKYLYQENAGVCVARNNGASKSNGDFLLFLDADDLISENFLDETVNILKTNHEITVVTSPIKFFGRGSGYQKIVSYDIATLLAENQIVITSLLRRDDFAKVGGFNLNMKDGLEDWDFWIALLKNEGKVQCAEKATFYYRLQNISRNNRISEQKEKKLRYQMWENHKDLYSKYFVDVTQTFEYKRYANSAEYRVGSFILRPIRNIKALINSVLSYFRKF